MWNKCLHSDVRRDREKSNRSWRISESFSPIWQRFGISFFFNVCDQESVMKPTHNLPEDVPTDRIFGSPMSGISSNWKRSSDTHLRNAPIRFCWHKNNVNFSIRDCTVSTITCSYLFLVSSFLWFLKYSPFFNFLPSDGCNGRRKVTCKDARLADNTTRFCQRNIPGMEKYHGDSLICTSLGFFPMPKRRPTLLSNIVKYNPRVEDSS